MITLNRRRKSTYIVHVGLPVMSDGSSLPFLSQVEKLPSSLSATDNPYTNLNSSMCTVHTVPVLPTRAGLECSFEESRNVIRDAARAYPLHANGSVSRLARLFRPDTSSTRWWMASSQHVIFISPLSVAYCRSLGSQDLNPERSSPAPAVISASFHLKQAERARKIGSRVNIYT
jgi:hypothetical protein